MTNSTQQTDDDFESIRLKSRSYLAQLVMPGGADFETEGSKQRKARLNGLLYQAEHQTYSANTRRALLDLIKEDMEAGETIRNGESIIVGRAMAKLFTDFRDVVLLGYPQLLPQFRDDFNELASIVPYKVHNICFQLSYMAPGLPKQVQDEIDHIHVGMLENLARATIRLRQKSAQAVTSVSSAGGERLGVNLDAVDPTLSAQTKMTTTIDILSVEAKQRQDRLNKLFCDVEDNTNLADARRGLLDLIREDGQSGETSRNIESVIVVSAIDNLYENLVANAKTGYPQLLFKFYPVFKELAALAPNKMAFVLKKLTLAKYRSPEPVKEEIDRLSEGMMAAYLKQSGAQAQTLTSSALLADRASQGAFAGEEMNAKTGTYTTSDVLPAEVMQRDNRLEALIVGKRLSDYNFKTREELLNLIKEEMAAGETIVNGQSLIVGPAIQRLCDDYKEFIQDASPQTLVMFRSIFKELAGTVPDRKSEIIAHLEKMKLSVPRVNQVEIESLTGVISAAKPLPPVVPQTDAKDTVRPSRQAQDAGGRKTGLLGRFMRRFKGGNCSHP